MRKITCLLLCLCLLLPGCASSGTKLPVSLRSCGPACTGETIDEETLGTFMAFYNAEPETEEDVTAKSIALDKLMSKLKKRRSPYLERSGVFLLGYPKENVKEWSNSKLEEMYKAVGAETVVYKKRKTAYVDEKDALNKIRMTAREEVIKEKIRRDNFRNMLGVSCDLVIFLLRFAIPI